MIRNGFVSNSSSSSFILSFNKNYVVKGASNIVDFIKDNSDDYYEMYLHGGEYGEGELLFKLTEEHKSLIRKYKEEFINHPGSDSYELYYGEGASNANYLYEDSIFFTSFGENEVANILKPKSIWTISLDEYHQVVDDYLEKLCSKTPNRDAEHVDISWHLDVDKEEFFNLFLSDEEECDRSWVSSGGYEEVGGKPYALSYKERISNRSEIINYLKYSSPNSNIGLCWLNEAYEDVVGKVADLEMFVLGSEEIEYIIDHEDLFLNSSVKVSLFIDYRFYRELMTINSSDVGKNVILRAGKFKEVVDCFDDFAEVFFFA